MASGLRAGTAWYGMRPAPVDTGAKPQYPDKTDSGDAERRRRAGVRAQRQRRYQSGSARIVGPI